MSRIPALLRPGTRRLLRAWGRTGIAPGRYYQAVEAWGRRLDGGTLRCRLFNGCEVDCRLTEHIQRHIYFFGAYEPIEAHLFERLLAPGMVVVDAGANIGQYSLIAGLRVGPTGRVHAFEPVPANFDRLNAHVERNGLSGIVRPNRLALWDAEADLTMHLDAEDRDDNATDYTLGQGHAEAADAASADVVSCRTVRLDDYARAEGLERLDVIKMDIEGAELGALQGGIETLRRFRPRLLMEINRQRSRQMGYEPEAIWSLLEPLGYRIWTIGIEPEASGPLDSFDGLERVNVLLHVDDLPAEILGGWSLKGFMRQYVDI
ncbi:hypothetical protein BH23PLA1_BH23PLA1_01550 [soil metagenome]